MKKLFSDPPDLEGSQKNLPIHLIWDASEETFRLITSYAASPWLESRLEVIRKSSR